jgi:hypothetical protein
MVPIDAVIDPGAAPTLLCAAATAAAVTVTVVVWLIATPAIWALTVFAPAAVELSVPVVTPLAFVGPAGCTTRLPLPVAASATLTPATGLPVASRAVTVIVLVIPPAEAAMVPGVAVTVLWDAETVPTTMLNAELVPAVRPVALAVSV